jgi:hypothetical protein
MLRIQITKSGLATIGKRGFQEVGREAIRAAAEYWWKTYLPLHFQNIAYLRYRFASRDRRTNEYKRERRPWPFGEHTEPAIGEVKPLVYSGRTREKLLSRQNIKAKASNFESYYAEVILDAPALNFSATKRINLRDEITRDNAQEQKTLDDKFTREWNYRLKIQGFLSPRRTKKIAA